MILFLETLQAVLLFAFNLAMICLVLKERKKLTAVKYYSVMAAGFAAATVLGYVLAFCELAAVWPPVYIVTYFSLTMLMCALLFHCRPSECIFLYFVIQTYVDDTFMLAKIVQYYFLSRITDNLLTFYPSQIVVVLAGLPVICLFAKKQLKPLIDTTAGMKFWSYIWMMPLSFYIVFRIGISTQYVALESLWTNTDVIVPVFWAVATILAYVMVVGTLLEVVRHVEDRERLESVSRQLLMQKEQYQRLSASIEDTRRMRHDLRHQMQVIAAYADRGYTDKIEEYVDSYLKKLDTEEEGPLCLNHAVDSIVRYYKSAAEQEGIRMEAKLETLVELPVNEIDVCVVLGNLLENALEACLLQTEGDRYIDLKMGTGIQSYVAIVLKNSGCGKTKLQNGQFLSTKRNFAGPGIGLSSVKRIAERYHGTAEFECAGKEFHSRVLLNREGTEIAAIGAGFF